MSRLTDTQLIILSAASQRDDRGVELPANIKGEAARKVVDKLIRAGLLEEVPAGGSLPVWRRDDDSGPMALRITKTGLEAIDVEDAAVAGPKETSVRSASTREVETPAPKAIASRKPMSVAAQNPARKKHHPAKAKTKAGSLRESRPGSKQARVLAMLVRPEGPHGSFRSLAKTAVETAARDHRAEIRGAAGRSPFSCRNPRQARRVRRPWSALAR